MAQTPAPTPGQSEGTKADADPKTGPTIGSETDAAAEPSDPLRERRAYLLDRLAAGASVGYLDTERSQILSEIHFDFPFLLVRQKSLFVLGSLQTSTLKTGSSIKIGAFEAQDIEYRIEAGARDYLSNRVAVAAFLGLQGREELDRPGSRQIRYLGLGFESVGFPKPGGQNHVEWRLVLGPALQRSGVRADAVVRGAILWDIWRWEHSSIGLDGSFDSIFDNHHGQTEYRVGPRWTLPLENGIQATLFSEWIRGRNPLGIEQQGWNIGVKYAEGAYTGPHTVPLPDVRGVLSFGRTNGRGFGRFDLDLSSPAFQLWARPARVFANLDADVVAGTGVDNLFYIATAGVEAEIVPRLVVGPYLTHRSNHTLGESLAGGATSLNIVQISARTPGWEYEDRLPDQLSPLEGTRWLDRIEGTFAPGLVTNSSFTGGKTWNLQAGARYDFVPRSRRVVPFVRLFGEWGNGDVDRREASAGIATAQHLVIELRYRRDEMLLGDDHDDVFLLGSLFF